MIKKVLLIDSREGGDWSLDLLFAGLVNNLGVENVIDFPSHLKHRMGKPNLIGDNEKDWGAERMSLSYTHCYDKGRVWTRNDVISELRNNNIDMIFIDENVNSYNLFLSIGGHIYETPVTVVSGHDKFWNVSPEWLKKNYYRNCKFMFLDNWRDEYNKVTNANVYNWSINFDHLWNQNRQNEKVYDISFMGYNSHPDRERFLSHIINKYNSKLKLNFVFETRPNSFAKFVNKHEYFKQISQSKICLNLRGAAENGKTLRFYEIPYVGACLLTQDSNAMQLYKFENNKHAAYFSNERELDDQIEMLLEDDNYKLIATNGFEHATKYHSVSFRIKEILDKVNG